MQNVKQNRMIFKLKLQELLNLVFCVKCNNPSGF